MTGRRTIAVAGTHGKTTTTSMVTLDPAARRAGPVLRDRRRDLRGRLERPPRHRRALRGRGRRERPVVPASTARTSRSSPTSTPTTSTPTATWPALEDAFVEFCRPGRAGRLRGAPAPTTRGARRLAERAAGRGPTGPHLRRGRRRRPAPDRAALLARTAVRYLAILDGEPLGEISLPVPGRHLGPQQRRRACSPRCGSGCRRRQSATALAAFPGVRRRFELKGVADGVRVYDEYAYHPTAMTAALQTLREVAGDGRLIVVFQPYRVYRTRDLQAEIAAALAIADEAIVMEVFGPGEVREPGEGGDRADRGGRPAAPTARCSCRPGRTWPARCARGPARATWWSPWARRRSR